MELQVGVKILLRNSEGRYLLVRRSSEKYPEVGAKWYIVGGRIEPGTGLLENLRREVKEETGLGIEDVKLAAAQDILRVPGRHVVRLTFIGKTNGDPKLNSENTEFKWLSREELETTSNLDIYLKELLEKNTL